MNQLLSILLFISCTCSYSQIHRGTITIKKETSQNSVFVLGKNLGAPCKQKAVLITDSWIYIDSCFVVGSDSLNYSQKLSNSEDDFFRDLFNIRTDSLKLIEKEIEATDCTKVKGVDVEVIRDGKVFNLEIPFTCYPENRKAFMEKMELLLKGIK